MAKVNPIVNLIRQGAKARGLDPAAVLAVASREGLGGGVGDNGTSFGPFQLHVGGALPTGLQNPEAWATSPAGINYALSHIAGIARGLRGNSAVNAIVRQLERPANPDAEVAGALGAYGRFSGGAPTPPRAQPPLNPSSSSPGGTVTTPGNAANIMAALKVLGLGGLPGIGQLVNQKYGPTTTQLPPLPGFNGPGKQITPKIQAEGKVTAKDLQVVQLAKNFIGTPYVWGGSSPKAGFDCSGLIQYVWAQRGVQIPRTTYDQYQSGAPVAKADLRPGDAVFFTGSDPKNGLPGHIGMYIGNGKFIEAPHTGATVRIARLAGRTDYVGARRYG